MFYNVENFFDIYNDSLTEDDDFIPSGLMRWNYKRYEAKINSLYKVIMAAGEEWAPPDLVGFCEVENSDVLDDLIYGTYLSKYDYSFIHEDSPDRRGIDVCLIYRKSVIKVINYSYWIPEMYLKNNYKSRSVLYAKLITQKDTLHVIVNHWPSRRGGVLAGEEMRNSISKMIRDKSDSLMRLHSSGVKVIIMGDFNSTPDDNSIYILTKAASQNSYLINLASGVSGKGDGTYRYQGNWEIIDQILVSDNLINCNKGLYTTLSDFKIFNPGFLLKKDPKYPGMVPFSTYRGYKYQGGFSDHLPVILDLHLR
jgi:predicted extracellular nuclease